MKGIIEELGEPMQFGIDDPTPLMAESGYRFLRTVSFDELALEYTALPGEAAAEVAGWLQGEYTFDPACLTD